MKGLKHGQLKHSLSWTRARPLGNGREDARGEECAGEAHERWEAGGVVVSEEDRGIGGPSHQGRCG